MALNSRTFRPQHFLHLSQRQAVDHILPREPAFAGGFDAIDHRLQSVRAVGIGVDAAFHAFRFRELPPAPVHVQTPRAGVELDDGAGFRGGIDHGSHVHIVSRALQQQPSREMSQHGDVRILNGSNDALRHLRLGQIEDVVHGGDHIIELAHNLVTEIEAAILENVHLAAGKDAEALFGHLLIQCLDLFDLFQQSLLIQPIRLERRLAVIGDAKVLQTQLMRRLRHLAQSRATIAGGGVVVKDTAQILKLDEAWQTTVLGGIYLARVLPQLRIDEVEIQRAVEFRFIMNRWNDRRIRMIRHRREAILIERPATSKRTLADGHIVLLAAGEVDQRKRELLARYGTQIALHPMSDVHTGFRRPFGDDIHHQWQLHKGLDYLVRFFTCSAPQSRPACWRKRYLSSQHLTPARTNSCSQLYGTMPYVS